MRMRKFTEILERNHLDMMTKINQITDATLKLIRIMDAKIQQGNTSFSHATMMNSTKQEVRSVKLDF
ncbi:hypothetical protein TSUD_283600 [Trifolium subterraneum]|uniref:Uncharacterized protein n=1 Tax=Trifolium subterraneum TaxID=3900 RepID=A0A2Z6NGH1_TRISU|nr:hypothetical protein TSUD_283600 [Trifolium subterraneum]